MQNINVTRSSMPSYEEYCEEIKSIWETVHLTNMGPIHNKLKEQLAKYLKVKNIELFVNGHLALYCAIKALKLEGEIITTPFTFASTTNAIMQAGCTPVFCDIKEDYTIDESKIEALITEKTVAILGVHVFGNVCNVEEIERIAKKHNLKVIYDGAHTFGVEYKGKGIASYGDACMLSFHATKVFNTIEGGAVCFNDEELAQEINWQKNFGCNGPTLECFGTNAKMNEFQAAMGICNLRHIDDALMQRGKVYDQYSRRLEGINGIKLLKIREGAKQNYAYFPILVDSKVFGKDRNDIHMKLRENGINARKYFYPLVSANKEFKEDLTIYTPKAKYISDNILCLPLYAGLEEETIDLICDLIVY